MRSAWARCTRTSTGLLDRLLLGSSPPTRSCSRAADADEPRRSDLQTTAGSCHDPGRGLTPAALLPALTSLLALLFAVALLDQWRERRHGFQLIWAIGMLFYGVGAGCEALAAAGGWNEALYRGWYLTGAVWTAGWLGPGDGVPARTDAVRLHASRCCLFLRACSRSCVRNKPEYAGAGPLPLLYFIGAGILALAVAVETYFENDRWPRFAAGGDRRGDAAVGRPHGHAGAAGARLCADPDDRAAGGDALPGLPPAADAVPEHHRGLRAGPRRHLLDVRVHAQAARPGLLARSEPAGRPVPVQPAASRRSRSWSTSSRRCRARSGTSLAGRLHSRVPATILIAIGAFFPTITDSLNRFGSTELFQLGKFLGVVFLFAGFLVSVEVFREIRIPFTLDPPRDAPPGARPPPRCSGRRRGRRPGDRRRAPRLRSSFPAAAGQGVALRRGRLVPEQVLAD